MLRSRFQSLPGAFNARLIPEEKSEPKKKGIKATLSRKFAEVNSFYFYLILSMASCIFKSIVLAWSFIYPAIATDPV